MSKAFDKITLKIPSATPGWNLDVWQYLPVAGHGSQPFPVIVMWVTRFLTFVLALCPCATYRAHGLTATKNMKLDTYAECFAEHGYACLVFDYRRWGDSGTSISPEFKPICVDYCFYRRKPSLRTEHQGTAWRLPNCRGLCSRPRGI